ncbi:MAG: phosphatidylglycerol lysyltransferase domain-containing protein [Bacillota bacterium]|nr:phosphatidylglycerol lysyltransferase domain-containing protein [Bacillota bacterium]
MLIFKKLTIDDKKLIDKYIKPYKFSISEYSFTTLLIWRKGCDIEYAIYNQVLIIKKRDFRGNYHFMQPIGYKKEDLKEIIEVLKEYKEEHGLKYLFKDVEDSFIEDIKEIYSDQLDMFEDRDNFDYIYESEKLITLAGKKLHSKKNHYNFFIKTYEYVTKDINEEGVIADCIRESRKWYEKNFKGDQYLLYELEGIEEVLINIGKLELKGMAVYIDGEVAAFTIGEAVNEDMAIIHIEKGDADKRGVYTFINKTFVEKYFYNVATINREQDLGIEGLRKAKKSYHPIRLQEKYLVNL